MFTLILVSSYTANLAASLTAENLHTPIESADHLANQNDFKYGCLKGGSTYNFFKVELKCRSIHVTNVCISQEADMGTYYLMWNYMSTNQDVFTSSNTEGIERVKETQGGK